ncbi:3-methyl-2-oxobutanoate hydroxymethyltransferase [Corallococcus sp. AB004]|uniref:3-methyl-2-oxobutanoate hydroxymethyltransferase n=1 Tax=Corallococcus TaxID=83461 RepID=UPI000EA02511|nr:3-methyl-2-oxobutanoate hydroxymethyltransferase [Corallococcus sp. AB038B]MBN8466111.1 3-methyl-2-oxobutanoate hydroxymethyltransferase [Corallococcus exiguus]RKI35565.1 3-methyl-2-oxobutanoate hydroxymethyltransferase [Corallococcus sp. AB004]NPC74450.1 3-methyl-2-oxobutanoate hydroxymethyltransferase [Corallococcus exiguus]NRD48959.1 3-methyl-2-oxobutanoate hydroxymethyltransferase [Corallococcus exiguus]RKI00518.1 3-methyl-2-oxobutanoate hydroxymethyltransferase [Corallococcus sp. AB038
MKDKVTIHTLKRLKQSGQKICMVTAYDATFARILDEGGADVLLVGDSLGMVIQGQESTLPVTMDQMVYHSAAVSRGAKRAHVVGDLPFMSYQVSPQEAVRNAGRLVSEGNVGSVKLEGGAEFADTVRAIVRASIPVMGHLGLTPQSVHKMGGYVVQGRDEDAARRMLDDALALEAAGAYALVLEGVPLELARTITQSLKIPTIGIGAGKHCDGQVLVCYDLLGMNPDFKPKFVKRFANLHGNITEAANTYFSEVRAGTFPDEEHSFKATKGIRLVTPTPVAPDAEGAGEPAEKVGGIYGAPV